ncbi:hypothetical protein FE783_17435 [Paenibacillus mesophilus]|uniref:hypothetical protein n=1 Tax=Paenibacillus mesophilus TaxID=2582849 RepID=UPI00110DA170|nr:hypothetical protein [Paenibacillus mesophilus]TMV48306.1 hypothetical protein FE783_17435 [Paenibacillus mesophilus]
MGIETYGEIALRYKLLSAEVLPKVILTRGKLKAMESLEEHIAMLSRLTRAMEMEWIEIESLFTDLQHTNEEAVTYAIKKIENVMIMERERVMNLNPIEITRHINGDPNEFAILIPEMELDLLVSGLEGRDLAITGDLLTERRKSLKAIDAATREFLRHLESVLDTFRFDTVHSDFLKSNTHHINEIVLREQKELSRQEDLFRKSYMGLG